MKSIKELNLELAPINHTIRVFNAEGAAPTFALVKLKPDAGFLSKLLGFNTQRVVTHTASEEAVRMAAEQILGANI